MRSGLLTFAVIAFAHVAFAVPSDIDVARQALGAGLWTTAEHHARLAEESATGRVDLVAARLVEIEAIAGAGRVEDIPTRIDSWSDATEDGFRYWRAWAMARSGKKAEARKILSEPFADSSFNILAQRLVARLVSDGGNVQEAEKLYRSLDGALVSNIAVRAENALEWARMKASRGDAAGALEVMERQGVADAPGAAGDALRLYTAELKRARGDVAGARKLFAGLVQKGNGTSEDAFVRASCALAEDMFSSGSTNEAVRVASNALVRASSSALSRLAGFTLGFIEMDIPTRRSAGRARISELLRKHAGAADVRNAHMRFADGLLAGGEAAASLEAYGSLLEAYPEHALDAHVQEGRGWAFMELGKRAEAVGAFARAAQLATNESIRARYFFKQGDVLVADGRFSEAVAAYARVTNATLSGKARFRQADALARTGKDEDSRAIFRSLLDEGGAEAIQAGLRLASAEVAGGRFENAITLYGKLLEMPGVDKVETLFGRGRALYLAYRWEEASRDFETVAGLVPARADEMAFLSALCRYGAGHEAEAVEFVRGLLARTSSESLRAELSFWLAKADAARGNPASAQVAFEQCATNRFLPPMRALEAAVRAVRCAAAVPDHLKTVELARKVLMRPEAADAEKKVLPATSFVAETLLLQGEALTETARFDEAVLVLERAERIPAGEEVRRRAAILKADCLFAMGADDDGRYRQALAAYRDVLQDARLSASLRLAISFKIARTLEKLRRFDEAEDQYYTHVVLAYWDAVRPDGDDDVRRRAWLDGNARTFFARAVLQLADRYEARGERRQAAGVLRYLAAANIPASVEARRRIAKLEEGGGR